MKKDLTTTQNTNLVLKKSKSMLDITDRILSGSRSLTKNIDKSLAIHPDIMMFNGLMWEKESQKMTWYDAMEYAQNLRLGGYDDWRVPIIEELEETVEALGDIPIVHHNTDYKKIFNQNKNNNDYQYSYKEKGFSSDYYWSSTMDYNYSGNAWFVDFSDGGVRDSNKTNSYVVRCVRGGE